MRRPFKTILGSSVLAALAAWANCLVGPALADLPAFPGAVGQGAAAVGGRGGDVYHVTTLADYDPDREEKIPGSFRHAVRSAEAPRTIVFDVAGAIRLHAPLEIRKSKLTIAGQTSPGGVTVWGYPTEVAEGSDIVIRYLRFRLGDFNARHAGVKGVKQVSLSPGGNSASVHANNLDPGSANAVYVGGDSQRVILDHVSASWSMDETLSVTRCRDITVQNSIIAEALNHSLHPKGEHGYGSLIRGQLTESDQASGIGGFTLYGNLWAHNKARNPSIGGEQSIPSGHSESDRRRTDVNIVNNVVYDWGDQATHRSELGDVRINLVGNYYVTGPAKKAKYVFREKTAGRTEMFARGNFADLDQDPEHDGAEILAADAPKAYQYFTAEDELRTSGQPINCFGNVETAERPAPAAYDAVLAGAGASLWRDAIDSRIIDSVKSRTGGMIDSQDKFRGADGRLPGIDDMREVRRGKDFDADGDGMPDAYEKAAGLNANDPADGASASASGYTNLEVYLDELTHNEE